jgi:hypothetical protein
MRSWLSGNNNPDRDNDVGPTSSLRQRNNAQRLLLDYAALGRLKEFPKRRDNQHYSCGLSVGPAPSAAYGFETARGDAMLEASVDPKRRLLATTPCVDWMNLVVVDHLLRLAAFS